MIHYNVYPGKTRKIVTFSYDDGPKNDKRLVPLFNQYNLKATFHLNALKGDGAEERKLYAGHEISCHTLLHGYPTEMPDISLVNEVLKNRRQLESAANYPVVGMSYPFGNYNARTVEVMRDCGIVYSRTTKSTHSFGIPSDFMVWNPTCHHNDASADGEKFLKTLDSPFISPLLYIWGHSYEFDTEEKWEAFEEVCKKLANNPKIWYATNIEIYNYVQAQKRLVISEDERMIYNPSALTVYIKRSLTSHIEDPDGDGIIIEIKPGETWREEDSQFIS